MTNEEKRIKVNELLKDANTFNSRSKYEDAEKLYLKAARMMENVYRQTFSNKDKSLLLNCYYQIADFYQFYSKNDELVQRWYQKIVGILQESCDKYFSLDEYRLLLEWYIKAIDIMISNHDYIHVVMIGHKMNSYAKSLYKKTKTNEDIKFIILSEIYIANAYKMMNKKIRSYYYYTITVNKMTNIYQKYNDIGIKNDLIEICSQIILLTNKGLLKLFNRRWRVKLALLKGEN